MMQPIIMRSSIKGLVNGSGMKSERPLRELQNIQRHGQLNGVKSGNTHSINFLQASLFRGKQSYLHNRCGTPAQKARLLD